MLVCIGNANAFRLDNTNLPQKTSIYFTYNLLIILHISDAEGWQSNISAICVAHSNIVLDTPYTGRANKFILVLLVYNLAYTTCMTPIKGGKGTHRSSYT